jgi:hypothetical protein
LKRRREVEALPAEAFRARWQENEVDCMYIIFYLRMHPALISHCLKVCLSHMVHKMFERSYETSEFEFVHRRIPSKSSLKFLE